MALLCDNVYRYSDGKSISWPRNKYVVWKNVYLQVMYVAYAREKDIGL